MQHCWKTVDLTLKKINRTITNTSECWLDRSKLSTENVNILSCVQNATYMVDCLIKMNPLQLQEGKETESNSGYVEVVSP